MRNDASQNVKKSCRIINAYLAKKICNNVNGVASGSFDSKFARVTCEFAKQLQFQK
tara:strand:- start:318 stop:485 length:168 start_codon:yes stop_codon:yes gene_type:complete